MLILAKQKEYLLDPRLDIRFTSMENDTMVTQLIPVRRPSGILTGMACALFRPPSLKPARV